MAVKSMQDLLLEELRDIYSAERIASRAYPKLRKALVTEELGQAVERHLEETKGQIERLGQIFDKLETRSRGKTCHAMEGLVEEAQEHLEKNLAPELLEVALVAELQKMEHYEIAAYGSTRAHAEALGLSEVVGLLDETLEEEKKTEQLLNDLALRTVNPKAVELGR